MTEHLLLGYEPVRDQDSARLEAPPGAPPVAPPLTWARVDGALRPPQPHPTTRREAWHVAHRATARAGVALAPILATGPAASAAPDPEVLRALADVAGAGGDPGPVVFLDAPPGWVDVVGPVLAGLTVRWEVSRADGWHDPEAQADALRRLLAAPPGAVAICRAGLGSTALQRAAEALRRKKVRLVCSAGGVPGLIAPSARACGAHVARWTRGGQDPDHDAAAAMLGAIRGEVPGDDGRTPSKEWRSPTRPIGALARAGEGDFVPRFIAVYDLNTRWDEVGVADQALLAELADALGVDTHTSATLATTLRERRGSRDWRGVSPALLAALSGVGRAGAGATVTPAWIATSLAAAAQIGRFRPDGRVRRQVGALIPAVLVAPRAALLLAPPRPTEERRLGGLELDDDGPGRPWTQSDVLLRPEPRNTREGWLVATAASAHDGSDNLQRQGVILAPEGPLPGQRLTAIYHRDDLPKQVAPRLLLPDTGPLPDALPDGAALFDDAWRLVAIVRDRHLVPAPALEAGLRRAIGAEGPLGDALRAWARSWDDVAAPVRIDPLLVERARHRGGEPVRALVRTTDTAWRPPVGVALVARLQGLAVVSGPPGDLMALHRDPAVRAVDYDRQGETMPAAEGGGGGDGTDPSPLIDRPGVRDAHAVTRGEGALVAIIDGGFNLRHAAFAAAEGRVVGLWDQGGAGPTPASAGLGPDFGAWYPGDALAAYTPPDNAATRHGTAVAAVAAGAPFTHGATSWTGGVAPAANLLLIALAPEAAGPDAAPLGYASRLVSALSLIEEVARQRGQPVVVNLSAGMHAGAHDGTTLVEQAIDTFTDGGRAPGRAFVKSAGNHGRVAVHRRLDGANGGVLPLKLGAGRTHLIELWMSSRTTWEVRVARAVLGTTERTPPAVYDDPTPTPHPLGAARVRLHLTRLHPDNGDSRALLVIERTDDTPLGGAWSIEVRPTRPRAADPIDAWVELETEPTAGGAQTTFDNDTDDGHELTIPGTARGAITVGSGLPSSSEGPTRDLRRKPEVRADGTVRVPSHPGKDTMAVEQGTSFAAPQISGMIALAFSRGTRGPYQPNANQLRAALIASTHEEDAWSPKDGWDTPHAAALLSVLFPPSA